MDPGVVRGARHARRQACERRAAGWRVGSRSVFGCLPGGYPSVMERLGTMCDELAGLIRMLCGDGERDRIRHDDVTQVSHRGHTFTLGVSLSFLFLKPSRFSLCSLLPFTDHSRSATCHAHACVSRSSSSSSSSSLSFNEAYLDLLLTTQACYGLDAVLRAEL